MHVGVSSSLRNVHPGKLRILLAISLTQGKQFFIILMSNLSKIFVIPKYVSAGAGSPWMAEK